MNLEIEMNEVNNDEAKKKLQEERKKRKELKKQNKLRMKEIKGKLMTIMKFMK